MNVFSGAGFRNPLRAALKSLKPISRAAVVINIREVIMDKSSVLRTSRRDFLVHRFLPYALKIGFDPMKVVKRRC
jgi:hypothetical protein